MGNNHVHISFMSFLIFGAMSTIWSFLWRFVSIKYAHTPFGQAMGFID